MSHFTKVYHLCNSFQLFFISFQFRFSSTSISCHPKDQSHCKVLTCIVAVCMFLQSHYTHIHLHLVSDCLHFLLETSFCNACTMRDKLPFLATKEKRITVIELNLGSKHYKYSAHKFAQYFFFTSHQHFHFCLPYQKTNSFPLYLFNNIFYIFIKTLFETSRCLNNSHPITSQTSPRGAIPTYPQYTYPRRIPPTHPPPPRSFQS